MKNRDLFIPSLSSILIAGMIAFLSCAHQVGEDDEVDTFESMVSEEESGSASNENVASNLEASHEENSPQTQSQSNEMGGPQPQAESQMAAQPSVVIPPSSDVASSKPQAESTADNSLPESVPSESGDIAAGIPIASGSDDLSSKESDLDKSEPSSENSVSSNSATTEPTPAMMSSQPAPTPVIAPVASTPPKVAKTTSMVPKVPMKALKRKDALLNRFYFVRMGDSPESVSTMIYGSPEKSHQLWVSKGRPWGPGRMIFYNSPKKPTDTAMVSFYKEELVQGRKLKVKKGDWLSRIAKKYLGSPKSWREIAVMNRIDNPFDLKVGQKLVLFPEIQPKSQPSMPVVLNKQPVPALAQKIEPNNQPPAQVPSMANSPAMVASKSQPENLSAPTPPAPELQPRAPLAVKEENPVKKFSAVEYIRELIAKLTLMVKGKH